MGCGTRRQRVGRELQRRVAKPDRQRSPVTPVGRVVHVEAQRIAVRIGGGPGQPHVAPRVDRALGERQVGRVRAGVQLDQQPVAVPHRERSDVEAGGEEDRERPQRGRNVGPVPRVGRFGIDGDAGQDLAARAAGLEPQAGCRAVRGRRRRARTSGATDSSTARPVATSIAPETSRPATRASWTCRAPPPRCDAATAAAQASPSQTRGQRSDRVLQARVVLVGDEGRRVGDVVRMHQRQHDARRSARLGVPAPLRLVPAGRAARRDPGPLDRVGAAQGDAGFEVRRRAVGAVRQPEGVADLVRDRRGEVVDGFRERGVDLDRDHPRVKTQRAIRVARQAQDVGGQEGNHHVGVGGTQPLGVGLDQDLVPARDGEQRRQVELLAHRLDDRLVRLLDHDVAPVARDHVGNGERLFGEDRPRPRDAMTERPGVDRHPLGPSADTDEVVVERQRGRLAVPVRGPRALEGTLGDRPDRPGRRARSA